MLPKVILFFFIYLTTLSKRQRFVIGQGVGSNGNSSESSGPQGHSDQTHDSEDTDTDISYSCSASKVITIIPTIEMPLAKMSVLKKNGKGEACRLTKALINDCQYVAGDPVILILQDDENEKVVGGQNTKTFHLSCTYEGTFTVKSAPIGISVNPLSTIASFSKPANPPITLSLTTPNGLDLGGSIDIGQEIKMTMALADGNYLLSPQTCTAKGPPSNSYKIWDVQGPCTRDNSVIDEKWTGKTAQNSLEIKMYGFYFPTSTHVTIECTTKVCTTEHHAACTNNCLTLSSRRRRDAPTSKNDTFVYERSVQVAFDVAVNDAGGVNSAFATLPTKPVYGLIGLILYNMMQLST